MDKRIKQWKEKNGKDLLTEFGLLMKTCKDELVYTEDKKLVFKLYLRNIHNSITENDLRDYFTKYGDVKSVEIYSTKIKKKQIHKYSFVTFKEAKSAAEALRYKEYYIRNRKVRVKPADSWKQPDPVPDQDKDSDSNSIESKENDSIKSPIFRLNDDCLLYVYSFLTLGEQITLSETCVRFSEILKTKFCHKRALSIFKKDPITFVQLRAILIQVGHCLTSFSNESNVSIPNRKFKLISQMCPKLEKLKILNIYAPTSKQFVFKEIGLKLLNLTQIEFINCNISDKICQLLMRLENLNFIDLSHNEEITGVHLEKFAKLVYLKLTNCSNIKYCYIYNICQRGILKTLCINGISALNNDCLADTLLKLHHLESLAFTYEKKQNGINKISQLNSLKHLMIHNCVDLNVDFFKELVKNKSETLETLISCDRCLDQEKLDYIFKLKNLKKLLCLCDNNLADSFVQRLSDLKKLKFLGLFYYKSLSQKAIIKFLDQPTGINELCIKDWNDISEEFFFKIAEGIKMRGVKSRCKIYVTEKMSSAILKNERYNEYAPFISLFKFDLGYFYDL